MPLKLWIVWCNKLFFPMLILLGNGSSVDTWLKPVGLGLGLTFVLKKKKNEKAVFLVIRIRYTLSDSLIFSAHQVQFRLGSPLLCCRSPEAMGPLPGCRAFCILWAPFMQGDLLSCFAGFCHLPTPLPAAVSFLTSSGCSPLLQQTLSPDIFIQISLVMSTRLHIIWEESLVCP